uniref:Ig-like domain-containing protein n=1 Tax=Erpetoichthys calabaricus TaxID=27687 RepID=A0A8C4TJ80_ERPCA
CSAASLITPQNILNGTVGGEITFNLSIDPVNQTAHTGTWKYGPKIVVTWTNSNPVYTSDYKGRVEVTLATGTLKFNKLFATDSGEYTVAITTAPSGLNIGGRVELKVYDPVSLPTIQSNVPNPVEFSDTVTLTCTASGSDVSYRWFNGSSEVSDTPRIHLSADNRTLMISGILRSDHGPFYCYVFNHVSNNISKPFCLDVKSSSLGTVTLTTENLAGAIIGTFLGGVLVSVIAFLIANSIRRGQLCGKVPDIKADINENPPSTYENVHNMKTMDKGPSPPSPSTDHHYMGLQAGKQSIYHSLQGKMPS